jgi:hypothetical protein
LPAGQAHLQVPSGEGLPLSRDLEMVQGFLTKNDESFLKFDHARIIFNLILTFSLLTRTYKYGTLIAERVPRNWKRLERKAVEN